MSIVGLLCLRKVEDSKHAHTFSEIKGSVFCVAFSTDSKWIIASDQKNIIYLLSVDKKGVNKLLGYTYNVNTLDFSPDMKHIISGCLRALTSKCSITYAKEGKI